MNYNNGLESDNLRKQVQEVSVEIAQESSSLKALVEGLLLHIQEQGRTPAFTL